MITAGIDCGAKNTKTAILQKGRVLGRGQAPTGFDQSKAADESLDVALKRAGIARTDIQRIFATGSGKSAARSANASVNDIQAMVKGAFHFFPLARTAVDVGAEEGRAARLDEKGKLLDSAVNEKCAAGAGAFIEAMARALDASIEEMGALCLQSGKAIRINAQCVVFAESEVVGLIHSKSLKSDISRAIHDSIARRIVSLIRRIGVQEDVVLIGGLARNPGFISCMTNQLRVKRVFTPPDPEFGAAVGAAVAAGGGSR